MPKENKKRGRREEHRKRKRDVAEDEGSHKKQKSSPAEAGFVPPGEGRDDATAGAPPVGEMPFYGMLDEAEQEYFKRADEMLELNQFDGPDERDLFLANVYREADGKELKIANSQSCSRLMERLILLSSPAQLKALFQKFSGQYVETHPHHSAEPEPPQKLRYRLVADLSLSLSLSFLQLPAASATPFRVTLL